jgi:outer membrane protein OmpA-like peptidoglycan-associated protein
MLAVGAWMLPAEAQTTIYDGQIKVKIQRLRQASDSIHVDLEFDFTNLSVATERYLLLTPVLVGSQGREFRLKNIQINGRQQHKAFMREVELNGWQRQVEAAHYAVIGLNRETRGVFRYALSIGYEGWMREAKMNVITDLCGCGGEPQQLATEKVADRIILEGVEPYRVLPNVAYLRPEAEAVKARSESNDVFLDFPVARTEINPGFGNNPRELAKIETIINEIRTDGNVQVTGVSITGYASPEGDINFNNQLSRGRAESLRSHLASKSGIPPHLFRLGNGGEDWEGLTRLVEGMNNFGPKETVLSIIRYYNPAERKTRLKALDGGRLWQWMLSELFPRMRRVVSRIEYTVRGFNVEEAKQVIKTRPQQLSLNEMFLVANTYEEGSPEFQSVFSTAVRVFPNDPVANLNAAAAALLEKDLQKAERFLQKAQRNTPAYYNNLGVLMMMQNNLTRAKNLFQRAAEGNLEVALKNLEEVKKKEEADRQLTY